MNLLLKAIIALVIGLLVAWIVGTICVHYQIDGFYGWLAGVIAGLLYFLYGPVFPEGPRRI